MSAKAAKQAGSQRKEQATLDWSVPPAGPIRCDPRTLKDGQQNSLLKPAATAAAATAAWPDGGSHGESRVKPTYPSS